MSIRNNSESGDGFPGFEPGGLSSSATAEIEYLEGILIDPNVERFNKVCLKLMELGISPEIESPFGVNLGENWLRLYATPCALVRPDEQKVTGQRLIVNLAHRDTPDVVEHHLEIDDYYLDLGDNTILDVRSSRPWNPRTGNWRQDTSAGPVIDRQGLSVTARPGQDYSERLVGKKLSGSDTATMQRLLGHLSVFNPDMLNRIP